MYNRANSQRYATSFYRVDSEPAQRRYRDDVLELLARRPIYPLLHWARAAVGPAPCAALLPAITLPGLRGQARGSACTFVRPASLPAAAAQRLLPLAALTKALLTLDAPSAAAARACGNATVPLDHDGSIVLAALGSNPGCAAALGLLAPPAAPLPAGVYSAALLREVLADRKRLPEHVVVLVLAAAAPLPLPASSSSSQAPAMPQRAPMQMTPPQLRR